MTINSKNGQNFPLKTLHNKGKEEVRQGRNYYLNKKKVVIEVV